eukprot:gene10101-7068_t
MSYFEKTQAELGAVISAPKLSEKLLTRPPFRFLHDVVTNFIKTTGFPEGLFPEEMLDSAKVTEKEAKTEFMRLLIAAVEAATGSTCAAKPAKIIAGQEPENTNQMLQLLASCAQLSSDKKAAAVRKAKGGADAAPAKSEAVREEKKSEKKETEEERQKRKEEERRKRKEEEEKKSEKKETEEERQKRKEEERRKRKEEEVKKSEKKETEEERQKRKEEERRKRKEEETEEERQKRKEEERRKRKEEEEKKSEKKETEEERQKRKEEERRKRKEEEEKKSEKKETEEERQKRKEEERRKRKEEEEKKSEKKETEEERQKRKEEERRKRKEEERRKEKDRERDKEAQRNLEMASNANGVIREAKRSADDNDKDDKGEEDWQKIAEKYESRPTADIASNADESDVKGVLGQQALKAKREQELRQRQDDDMPGTIKDSGIVIRSGAAQMRSGTSMGENDLSRLREQLQMLTKASSPLGKFLEAIYDDIDSMVRELEMWRSESRNQALGAADARRQTEESLQEVQSQLKNLDDAINDQILKTNHLQQQIIANDAALDGMIKMIVNPDVGGKVRTCEHKVGLHATSGSYFEHHWSMTCCGLHLERFPVEKAREVLVVAFLYVYNFDALFQQTNKQQKSKKTKKQRLTRETIPLMTHKLLAPTGHLGFLSATSLFLRYFTAPICFLVDEIWALLPRCPASSPVDGPHKKIRF